MGEECEGFDPLCWGGDVAGQVIEDGAFRFVESLGDGTVAVLGWLNAFWLGTPTPDVLSFGVMAVRDHLAWYTFAFAVGGVLIACIRMGLTRQFQSGAGAAKMLLNLIVVSSALTVGFSALMTAGDAFAPWIVGVVTGEAMDLDGFLTTDMLLKAGVGPGLFLGTFAFIGALANVAFMILRDSLVLILFAFLPTLAAASATEGGSQAFKKALAWLFAFVLFKPVAGAIYALGILQLRSPIEISGLDDVATSIYTACVAVVILIAASLALPALIGFISPATAVGTSSTFSGGAVAAGMVASGAAVVALGATAGAAAPAVAGGGAMAGGAGLTAGGAAGGGAAGGGAAGGGAAGGGTGAGGGATGGGTGAGGGATGGGTGAGATGGNGGGAGGGTTGGSGGGATGGSGGDVNSRPTPTTSTAGAEPSRSGAPVGASGSSSGAQPSAPASSGAVQSSTLRDGARIAGDIASTAPVADGAMRDATTDTNEESR